MANWSQSHFLQSLGWATLNSFWQMALLWCLFLAANQLFKLSAQKKYNLSVLAVSTGFAWFLATFFYYFQSSPASTVALFNQTVSESNNLLNTFLLSASVAYLALLIFPSYRLFRNWQFVQRIKRQGLRKADLNYRLFVQKISGQLGIGKKVAVYVSELVKSPLTVGYIKPIVLLPMAALSNLSTQQVEAILLHELSHIRRYDYLVNFMVSIISTILYFNPFVKQFMKTIEEERENCCDQLVLQYGYDKVGYASALLTLEKLSVSHQVLALGATGKNLLLSRIETIVGMEKKKGFKRNQLTGMLAALFCIVIFNSVLIIRERKQQKKEFLAWNDASNPFAFFSSKGESHGSPAGNTTPAAPSWAATTRVPASERPSTLTITTIDFIPSVAEQAAAADEHHDYVQVGYDEIDGALTAEQRNNVKSTVEATKKVVSSLQWAEIEKSIGDAMTPKEKRQAKLDYMKALEKEVDWKVMEQTMKAEYENMDWNRINANVNNALVMMRLDSLEKTYTGILSKLDKANANCDKAKVAETPLPDQSVEELRKSTEELRKRVDSIKTFKSPRKVVRL